MHPPWREVSPFNSGSTHAKHEFEYFQAGRMNPRNPRSLILGGTGARLSVLTWFHGRGHFNSLEGLQGRDLLTLPPAFSVHPQCSSVLSLPCVYVPCASLLDWVQVGEQSTWSLEMGGRGRSVRLSVQTEDEPQEERAPALSRLPCADHLPSFPLGPLQCNST